MEEKKYEYFISGADVVYARDSEGNVYAISALKEFKPVERDIDPMWYGIEENEVDSYLAAYPSNQKKS